MKSFKKYLPSKKFLIIILFIATLLILFFTIKLFIGFLKSKSSDKNQPVEVTVGSIIQKDSNNNDIPDWEEYLWGLDPNKNGPKNKEFILSKKDGLLQNGKIYKEYDSKSITDNAILSRQFFATIMSLQQTGQIDEEAIQSISEAIGQEIQTTPINDRYTKDMLKIEENSEDAYMDYLINYGSLVQKYENEDIGSELTIISQGIVNYDEQALFSAKTIAYSYRSFGEGLMEITVPSTLSIAHLSLANNYEKTAQSIEGLSLVISNPIVGMRSLLNYKKYSDAIVSDFQQLSDILQ